MTIKINKMYNNSIEWLCIIVYILPLFVGFMFKFTLIVVSKIVEILQVIVVEWIELVRRVYQKSKFVLSVKD